MLSGIVICQNPPNQKISPIFIFNSWNNLNGFPTWNVHFVSVRLDSEVPIQWKIEGWYLVYKVIVIDGAKGAGAKCDILARLVSLTNEGAQLRAFEF